jgi:hypothetical protein
MVRRFSAIVFPDVKNIKASTISSPVTRKVKWGIGLVFLIMFSPDNLLC